MTHGGAGWAARHLAQQAVVACALLPAFEPHIFAVCEEKGQVQVQGVDTYQGEEASAFSQDAPSCLRYTSDTFLPVSFELHPWV